MYSIRVRVSYLCNATSLNIIGVKGQVLSIKGKQTCNLIISLSQPSLLSKTQRVQGGTFAKTTQSPPTLKPKKVILT